MRSAFEWQTDEDEAATATMTAQWGAGRRVGGRRLLLALLLLTLTTALLVLQLRRRQTLAQAQQEDAIRAASRVLFDAALGQDGELLLAGMTAKRAQWLSDQQVLARENLFFDRAPLGLWLAETDLADSLAGATISLNPEWDRATVVVPLAYQTLHADGSLETITLERTSHFGRHDNHWLAEPPPAGFWGAWRLEQPLPYLRIRFPARDEAIIRPMIDRLAGLMSAYCAVNPLLPCSAGDPMTLEFSPDSRALLMLGRTRPSLGRRWESSSDFTLLLPTPTLVGRPVDAAGAEALYRGYAAWTFFVFGPDNAASSEFLTLWLAENDLVRPPPPGYRPPPAQVEAPIPYPDAVVALDCPAAIGAVDRWLYDPAADTWTPDQATRALFVSGGVYLVNQSEGRLLGQVGDSTAFVPAAISPDGRWRLHTSNDAGGPSWELSPVGGGGGGQSIGRIAQPFWLDNTHFGYIAYDGAAPGDLVIRDLSQTWQTLSLTRLAAAAAETSLHIEQVAGDPSGEGRVFILTRAGQHNVALFHYDVLNDALTRLGSWLDDGRDTLPLIVSGRFITITRYDYSATYISLFDTETGQREAYRLVGRPIRRAAWSPDGRWLALADERLLRLIAPAAGFDRPVLHGNVGCTNVRWLPR